VDATGRVLTITPNTPLAVNSQYYLELTSGIKDATAAGNSINYYGLYFSTVFSANTDLSTLMSAGGCEIGDYDFTNFVIETAGGGAGSVSTIDSTNPNNVTVSLSTDNAPYYAQFELNDDTDHFLNGFILDYTVTLDPNAFPANTAPAGAFHLSEATTGVIDNGISQNQYEVSLEKQIYAVATGGGNGAYLGFGITTDNEDVIDNSGRAVYFGQPAVNVVDTYTVDFITGPGYINNLTNTYTQVGAEPSTMVLLGVALTGLGVFVRKRRRACA